jgi:hypothetical protein
MINFGMFRNLCVSHGSLQWPVPSKISHLMYISTTRIDLGFLKRARNFLTILNFEKLTRFLALPAGRTIQCKYFRL